MNHPTEFREYLHHPSCTPNDRDLVWHCNQCGLNESAADIEQQLAAAREALKLTRRTLAHMTERHDAVLAKWGEKQ